MLLVLVRAVLRVAWLANGAWIGSFLGLFYLAGSPPMGLVWTGLYLSGCLLLLTRVGFLSALVCFFVSGIQSMYVLTLHAGAWYFTSSLVMLVALAFLGAWAYRTAVTGRSAFESGRA